MAIGRSPLTQRSPSCGCLRRTLTQHPLQRWLERGALAGVAVEHVAPGGVAAPLLMSMTRLPKSSSVEEIYSQFLGDGPALLKSLKTNDLPGLAQRLLTL